MAAVQCLSNASAARGVRARQAQARNRSSMHRSSSAGPPARSRATTFARCRTKVSSASPRAGCAARPRLQRSASRASSFGALLFSSTLLALAAASASRNAAPRFVPMSLRSSHDGHPVARCSDQCENRGTTMLQGSLFVSCLTYELTRQVGVERSGEAFVQMVRAPDGNALPAARTVARLIQLGQVELFHGVSSCLPKARSRAAAAALASGAAYWLM